MNRVRPLVLAATTLLFISACSTPDDLTPPTLEPQFGTAADDIGEDVAVAPTGEVYALSEEFSRGIFYKVLLHRYNGSGTLVWSREVASANCSDYPECRYPTARTLQVDAQGNTYALVASYANYSFLDTYDSVSYTVYKYDAAGNRVGRFDVGANAWAIGKIGRQEQHEYAVDVAVDGGGNVYVAREQYTLDPDDLSVTYAYVVAKYATNGALLWQRLSTVGTPYGVTVSRSGSVYVVGTTGLARYTNDGNLTWTVKADNSRGVLENAGNVVVSGSNLYTRSGKDIRKYDGTGKQLWLKTQGSLDTIVVQDMTGDADGNLYLSGKYRVSTGNFSAFARKLSVSGSVLFTKTYGTTAYDDARGVATLSGSEIYLTGETQGSLAHPNRGGPENRDGYVRKLNSSGNRIWTR